MTGGKWAAGLLLAGILGGTAGAQDHPSPWRPETLDRGLVALPRDDGTAFLSWRLLADDPPEIAFHVERAERPGAAFTRATTAPLTGPTCWIDPLPAPGTQYRVVAEGEKAASPVTLAENPFLTIPLAEPFDRAASDGSAGDLDGDGTYELVIKREQRPKDNSQRGETGTTTLEAYRLDGRFLWRVDLGRNLREGAHYTPFLVYDFDGDGRAEVACRTADGTIDGQGDPIGDPNADHRNESGYVLDGPEFLTVFEGRTGRALATVDYLPPRGRVADWGDDYGNRVDRFLACVAYLDGTHPSLIFSRGYYTRAVLVAWDWRDGALSHRWTFDSDDGTPGNASYRGQGNHNLAVGDVDGDGRDEILYGACAIDDDGKGLYSNGLGHGDAMHLGDLDPSRPGLEVFGIHERPRHPFAAEMHDAATGRVLWGLPARDVPRGLAADIDPRHEGAECWAAGIPGLYDAQGRKIAQRAPRSCNFAVYWDGDPSRELLDRNRITKWDYERESEIILMEARGCTASNGSKATPVLSADLLGDWREEILWRAADNRALRLYSTTLPTNARRPTLMHDRPYRLGIAWQNVGYNQPPTPQ